MFAWSVSNYENSRQTANDGPEGKGISPKQIIEYARY